MTDRSVTKQECTDPTGHCTCYSRQVYGKCCSCKAINANPERAVVEGTIPSKEQSLANALADPNFGREVAIVRKVYEAEIERLRPKAESWDSYEAAQERKAAMGLTNETSTQPDIVGEYEAWIAEIAGDTEFCTPCVDKLAEYLQRKPQKSNWICACGHANATTVTLKVTHCSKCEAVRSTQEMK